MDLKGSQDIQILCGSDMQICLGRQKEQVWSHNSVVQVPTTNGKMKKGKPNPEYTKCYVRLILKHPKRCYALISDKVGHIHSITEQLHL